MNRRGFLGTLLAGIGALAIPTDQLLWLPPADVTLAPLEPSAMVTLDQIVRAVHFQTLSAWDGHGEIMSGTRIGDAGLSQQIGINLLCPDEIGPEGLSQREYIDPIARAFANELKARRMTRFARLPLPPGGYAAAEVSGDGFAVRGITMFHPVRKENHLRFDILGG